MRDPLELRLNDLAAALDWPPTPDLASSVGAAIRAEPVERRPSGWWPWRPARRGLVLALAGALLIAGVAAAVGIAIGGLRIVFGEPPPILRSASPAIGPERGLGREVSLDDARSLADFDLVLPSVPELGAPDRVYFVEPPAGGQVALAWDGGSVLIEFRADIGPDTFEKLITEGTQVDSTTVDGLDAWWIEGGEHFIYYVDADGDVAEDTIRFVGDTLVWERDGVTFRLEGSASLEDARRIAESVGE